MSGNSPYINLPGGPPTSHPQEQPAGAGAQGTPTSSLLGHAQSSSSQPPQGQQSGMAKVNTGRMVPIPGASAAGASAVVTSASGSPMTLGAASAATTSIHGAAGVNAAGVQGAGASNIQNVAPQHSSAAAVAGGSSVAAAAVAAVAANSTNQDLASLFECPVCFDYVLPPILQVRMKCSLSASSSFMTVSFQCHAGHLVCSNCRPKLTCCPTCRGQLGGNIRNLAMEKVASTVMFPCR